MKNFNQISCTFLVKSLLPCQMFQKQLASVVFFLNILMKHSDYANFEILTSNICYFITKCFAIFLREIWQNVLKREIFSLQNMKK